MNELKSYTEYAVSTPTADFVIGFDFNYGEDAVNVTVDDVPASEAGYTVVYLNETTIRLSPSVPSGVVRLQRETDIDQTDHAYRAGAKFIAQTMDENFEQLRHSQQEVRDGFVKLADDTYEIIDTLEEVGKSAQDAADAAEVAAELANNAAAQVNDKVSYEDFNNKPHNAMLARDAASAHPTSSILDASGETQQQVNYNGGSKWHSRVAGYLENERVVLANGDIVRSMVNGNANDPNVDMAGWISDNAASQIKFSDDTSVQGLYDAYKLKAYAFVTPEMFGAVANSWETDNTAALNAAFATGKDVYSTPDKVYTCNGNLRTQGQRCVGGWKIRSSKSVVGGSWTNTSNTYAVPCDHTYLQGVYMSYAYDLAELFAIRDLGYNTLLHYGGMHISGYDMDGTVQNLLDNAKTAGLQVFLGTQNSLNGMTLTDFVNAYKDHPSVLGFLIADEPTHNGVTVAQQQTKIDTMRALTTKPLACSDFTFDAFTEVLADGYDYIFGDIYNNSGETAEQTLYKMRSWLGLTTKRHANSKILPAVMGFKYNSGVDLETIINTSKIFAKACGGNFSCFGWDVLGESSISNGIRDTVSLQKLSKDICSYKTGVYNIPECYAWGAVTEQTSQVNYGLNDVISNYVPSDPYTVGLYEGINSYPAQMNGGAVEGGRTTPYVSTGQAISGIWFKHTFGAYISDIKMKKKNHFTVQSGMLAKGAADVILSVRGSSVGGYSLGSVLAELPKSGEVATVVFDNNGINDTFCIKYDCSVDPQFYRTYVRGVYITSDW